MGYPTIQTPWVSHVHTYHDKYVIVYNFRDVDPDTATKELTLLVHDLESVGLDTEIRSGYEATLLVFAKAPRNILGSAVYNSRVKDWLYGIVQTHPGDRSTNVEGAYEAENILSVYHLVNWPKSKGGAGITPGWGQWKNVDSIFPLHNDATNLSLLKYLSSRLILTPDDLDQVRNLFGTKVAYYFAFIQTYVVFLTFPAATGLIAWQFLPKYSLTYAILISVWCTIFIEYWKIQQVDLSIRWDVRGIGAVKVARPQFRWEKIIVEGGQTNHYFPRWKQVARQLLQIPFMVLSTCILGAIIMVVFALETLISEAYSGPYKTYMEYIPTILLGISLPKIYGYLESFATLLTDFENHRTEDNYDMSRTQKIFFLQIIANYLPIFITAFLYVPFGDQIIPKLGVMVGGVMGSYGSYLQSPTHVDGDRLRDEIIALTVTGQLSAFFEENIQPILKRKFREWYRDYNATSAALPSVTDDDEGEFDFLQSARRQATLEQYNVQDDIAEIVLQFGSLALFPPVWPLISIGFLINNIIELRTDFLKIVREQRRPAPVRTDGIGPWTTSLDCLTWAGSISTSAIVHLYGSNSIAGGAWWALPITIFIGEHISMGLRAIVRFALDRRGSEQIRKERNARYLSRVKHLEEIEANRLANLAGLATPAERERKKSIRATGSDAFFAKQIEDGASVQAGLDLMRAYRRADEVKQQPKID
ncbi:related to IST2 protein [Cephalotrichum gorgonifer]|uniref:Related to IST2 protein n=1 Tax=Cephalotrichum gorgonifer TaxID=2041049 RepID=A0AAE8MYV8_9PEZI|nr:related to IST2 protein [Cephalotrichum gorgonifer]